MRVPGEFTFLCLTMFFVVSVPVVKIAPTPHQSLVMLFNSTMALFCGLMLLITKLKRTTGKKSLIAGSGGKLV